MDRVRFSEQELISAIIKHGQASGQAGFFGVQASGQISTIQGISLHDSTSTNRAIGYREAAMSEWRMQLILGSVVS